MKANNDDKLIKSLIDRYIPYWPIFIISLIISTTCAYLYIHFTIPIYEAFATLIIKDEKKGVDEMKIMESMNAFASKKIVENELEVIQSRTLMNKVVENLNLYASVYEEKGMITQPVYSYSPIKIEILNPETIDININKTKYYFKYDTIKNNININNTIYPLDKWVNSSFGTIRFSLNENNVGLTNNALYFKLINTKIETANLLKNLKVLPANKLSTVVYLKIKDPIPEKAEDILNSLIYFYNEASVLERNSLAVNTLNFFEDRLHIVEKELEELEKEVEIYKSTNRIVDLGEQAKLYLQNIGDNDKKIAEIENQLAVLDKVENYVISKNLLSGIVPSTLGLNDPVLNQLLEKLYDSEVEYEKIKRTTAENNPILNSISNQIEKIRPNILENINNHKVNLQVSLENAVQTNSKYNTTLKNIPEKERELLEINRTKLIKNELFSFLLQKREEAALTYAPSAGDSRVVDAAQSTFKPVNPKKSIIYPIAFIFAFVLVISIVEGNEILNNKILYRSEVESFFTHSVVGELFYFKQKKWESDNINSNRLIAEQFRDIRVAMGLYGNKKISRKILVTSSLKGDGKSFVSENISRSLSASGKKTVLINFDLRKPSVSKIYEAPEEQKGLSEYISENLKPYELIKATEYDNLFIINTGAFSESITDTLLDFDLSNLFDYLEETFEYIIVDTPPLSLATDAYLISKHCDTTLFVVRHKHTTKEILRRIDHDTKMIEFKNISIVFNGITSRGYVKNGYGYEYKYV